MAAIKSALDCLQSLDLDEDFYTSVCLEQLLEDLYLCCKYAEVELVLKLLKSAV